MESASITRKKLIRRMKNEQDKSKSDSLLQLLLPKSKNQIPLTERLCKDRKIDGKEFKLAYGGLKLIHELNTNFKKNMGNYNNMKEENQFFFKKFKIYETARNKNIYERIIENERAFGNLLKEYENKGINFQGNFFNKDILNKSGILLVKKKLIEDYYSNEVKNEGDKSRKIIKYENFLSKLKDTAKNKLMLKIPFKNSSKSLLNMEEKEKEKEINRKMEYLEIERKQKFEKKQDEINKLISDNNMLQKLIIIEKDIYKSSILKRDKDKDKEQEKLYNFDDIKFNFFSNSQNSEIKNDDKSINSNNSNENLNINKISMNRNDNNNLLNKSSSKSLFINNNKNLENKIKKILHNKSEKNLIDNDLSDISIIKKENETNKEEKIIKRKIRNNRTSRIIFNNYNKMFNHKNLDSKDKSTQSKNINCSNSNLSLPNLNKKSQSKSNKKLFSQSNIRTIESDLFKTRLKNKGILYNENIIKNHFPYLLNKIKNKRKPNLRLNNQNSNNNSSNSTQKILKKPILNKANSNPNFSSVQDTYEKLIKSDVGLRNNNIEDILNEYYGNNLSEIESKKNALRLLNFYFNIRSKTIHNESKDRIYKKYKDIIPELLENKILTNKQLNDKLKNRVILFAEKYCDKYYKLNQKKKTI